MSEDLNRARLVPVPTRCPTCDSPAPHMHPSVQLEGEVQLCANGWHASTERGRRYLDHAGRRWDAEAPEQRREQPQRAAAVERFRQRVAMGAGLRDAAQSIAIDIDDAQAALDEIDRLTAALEAVRRELSKHGVS